MYVYDDFLELLRVRDEIKKKITPVRMTRQDFLLQKNKELFWIKLFRMWIVYKGWKNRWLYEYCGVSKTLFSKFLNGKYNKFEGGISYRKWFHIKNQLEVLMSYEDVMEMVSKWKNEQRPLGRGFRMWLEFRRVKISKFLKMLKDIDSECLDLKYDTFKKVLNGDRRSKKIERVLERHMDTIRQDIDRIVSDVDGFYSGRDFTHLDVNIFLDLDN
jgi:hypothetical protein